MMVLVSAIVTTHNRSELALKAIDSIYNQTYSNMEIIVVDDASDIKHKEIIEDYSRIKGFTYVYVDKADSKGGNHARNVGVYHSNGEYVAFLDDDDEWLPSKIEKQVYFLNKNPEYSFVGCGRTYEYDYDRPHVEDNVDLLREGDVSDYILYNIPYTTSAVMLRRGALDYVGMFDERLKFWQEYELEIRLSTITPFGVIRENLVLYRVFESDVNRLTNKSKGWYKTVRYINRKHRKLIKSKSEFVRRERIRLIAKDGLERAKVSGARKRRYLLMYCYLDSNSCMADYVKAFLEIDRFRDLSVVNKFLHIIGKL